MTNEETAKRHLQQAFAQPNFEGEEHLTAALVYAVLALNDTLMAANRQTGAETWPVMDADHSEHHR